MAADRITHDSTLWSFHLVPQGQQGQHTVACSLEVAWQCPHCPSYLTKCFLQLSPVAHLRPDTTTDSRLWNIFKMRHSTQINSFAFGLLWPHSRCFFCLFSVPLGVGRKKMFLCFCTHFCPRLFLCLRERIDSVPLWPFRVLTAPVIWVKG